MNPGALLRLLGRRAMVLTLAALVFLAATALFLLSYIGESVPPIYFAGVVIASAFTLVISFGGFLGKAIADLGRLQLARTVPGVRRQLVRGIALVAPIIAAVGAGLLFVLVPRLTGAIHPVTLWCLLIFALSLGISLGGYWLVLLSIAFLIPGEVPWILNQIHTSPAAVSLVALGATGLMLALRFRRYLAPRSGVPVRNSSSSTATVAELLPIFRTNRLPDGPDWNDRGTGISVAQLMRAGIHERLGRTRGMLWGRLASWVAVIFVLSGCVLYAAGRQKGLVEFSRQIFAAEHPQPIFVIMFAEFTGVVAYICAVSIDTSLIPSLWHPVSRGIRSRAIFWAHLRQNLTFGLIHLTGALLLILGFTQWLDTPVLPAVVTAFVLPGLLACLLMPIAQAIFPNGAEAFHRKVNPLTQLLGGLVGGVFCLLLGYWTLYWPVKGWHTEWSLPGRIALLAGVGVAIYAAYYHYLRHHYARADLRPRT